MNIHQGMEGAIDRWMYWRAQSVSDESLRGQDHAKATWIGAARAWIKVTGTPVPVHLRPPHPWDDLIAEILGP